MTGSGLLHPSRCSTRSNRGSSPSLSLKIFVQFLFVFARGFFGFGILSLHAMDLLWFQRSLRDHGFRWPSCSCFADRRGRRGVRRRRTIAFYPREPIAQVRIGREQRRTALRGGAASQRNSEGAVFSSPRPGRLHESFRSTPRRSRWIGQDVNFAIAERAVAGHRAIPAVTR